MIMADRAEQVSTTGLVDTKQQAGPTKRRQYSEALKRQMVAETQAPGASVSMNAAEIASASRIDGVFRSVVRRWAGDHDCVASGERDITRPTAASAVGRGAALERGAFASAGQPCLFGGHYPLGS